MRFTRFYGALAALALFASPVFAQQSFQGQQGVIIGTTVLPTVTLPAGASDNLILTPSRATTTVRVVGQCTSLAAVMQVTNQVPAQVPAWTTIPLLVVSDGTTAVGSISAEGFWSLKTNGMAAARLHVTALSQVGYTVGSAVLNNNTTLAVNITDATVLASTPSSSSDGLATAVIATDTFVIVKDGVTQTITAVASGASGNTQVNVTDAMSVLLTKINALTGSGTASTITAGAVKLQGLSSGSFTVSGNIATKIGFTGTTTVAPSTCKAYLAAS